jgi:LmbE family N-acetylglucosaminyl deacetylase
MEEQEGVLVVCAHSDDQILGCGGTIAKYAKQGIPVYTMFMSYGEKGMPHLKEDFVIRTRVNETHKANDIVGCKNLFFLGLKEGKFKQGAKETNATKKIINVIKKYNIKRVFTHSSVDNDIPNLDHVTTYNIVMSACRHLDVEIYSFIVWDFFKSSKKFADSIKLVVDISSTFRTKIRALHAYQTQFIQMSIPYVQTYINSIFNGLKYGYRFAEVFIREK